MLSKMNSWSHLQKPFLGPSFCMCLAEISHIIWSSSYSAGTVQYFHVIRTVKLNYILVFHMLLRGLPVESSVACCSCVAFGQMLAPPVDASSPLVASEQAAFEACRAVINKPWNERQLCNCKMYSIYTIPCLSEVNQTGSWVIYNL